MGEVEAMSSEDAAPMPLKLVCGNPGSTLELFGVTVAKAGCVVSECDVVGGVDKEVERRCPSAPSRLLNGEASPRLTGRFPQ